jgi:Rrf2 family protein
MIGVMPQARSTRARGSDTGGRAAPLNQTAEYALRAMASIAGTRNGRAATAIELARVTTIPIHYLSKVLRRLVAAGLLQSQKGHGGGFTLARPAAKIRFSDVLAAVGSAPARNQCAFGWGACDSRQPCPLHPAWSRLNTAFRDWADKTTLADVMPNDKRRSGPGKGWSLPE